MGIKSFFGIGKGKSPVTNKYNEAFFRLIGGMFTAYDDKGETYVTKGYNLNPTVFAVVSQQAKKTSAVPKYIKDIKDDDSRKKLKRLNAATKYDMSTAQSIKKMVLESKAYDKSDKDFPLERPNPLQTWNEIEELYKTMMKLNGNFYLYMVCRSHPQNMGEPLEVYVLPSQYTQIVIKDNLSLDPSEDPIDHYMLTYGNQYIKFEAENVIHVKYPNPNFGTMGEQLYGQSPLRAALRNIQSSNVFLDLNIKTGKSGGAYGLIHAKGGAVLQEGQAAAVKDKLLEMEASTENMAKIAAVSQEMGFTRLSLTADEMKPFEYLKYDEKQICNVLGWKDKLLNNDEGSNFGEYLKTLRKQVITDDIMPDLELLAAALNDKFLPRFKGYENCELIYDPTELPEMQQDMGELTTVLTRMLNDGVISRNEYRSAANYGESEDDIMNVHTVSVNTMTLEDAIENPFPTTINE